MITLMITHTFIHSYDNPDDLKVRVHVYAFLNALGGSLYCGIYDYTIVLFGLLGLFGLIML